MKPYTLPLLLMLLLLAACERPVLTDSTDGSVTITFQPTSDDVSRASSLDQYFSKLNVMIFSPDGQRVLDKVRTQTADDTSQPFGTMSFNLAPGTYTIVAVGHSSAKSATIKSLEAVQFTASDGEKLTDTFSHCSTLVVGTDHTACTLPMYRATAMVQFVITDDVVPGNFAYFIIDYTGGSANFNPTTLQGITKSTQSERRLRNSLMIHQAYTFPYLAASGHLKMTVTATDASGATIRQRTFTDVPVTRNRITTYTGHFFQPGDGAFTQSDFSFVIHADWDGEDIYQF